MSNVKNVTASKPKISGAVYRAIAGTTLPTDATTSLNEAFISLGYCSEDGLVNTNTPETDEVKAWGGDVVLNIQNSKKDEFKFTLIEALNEDVLKAVYGTANVEGSLSSGITLKANSEEQEVAEWCFEMILKGGALKRIVIPNGKITAIGDVTYSGSAAVGYEVTLACTPDSEGNTHYEYIKG